MDVLVSYRSLSVALTTLAYIGQSDFERSVLANWSLLVMEETTDLIPAAFCASLLENVRIFYHRRRRSPNQRGSGLLP
jgi:hypothetical protein